jgi:hypothetical protein
MPSQQRDFDRDSESAVTMHATAVDYLPNHTGDASVALSEGTSYRREMDLVSEILDDDISAVPSDVLLVEVNKELLYLGLTGEDNDVSSVAGAPTVDGADVDGKETVVTSGNISGAMSEAANVEQIRAEERFREVRENDIMCKEDAYAYQWHARQEVEARHRFSVAVHDVVQRDSVYQSHVDNLKLIAKKLKRLTVIEVLADQDTTWDRLAVRVFETVALEEEARQLAERLRTDAGKKRQKMIQEHAEDIEELSAFFREKAGLSKTNSRNAATEAVLKNISTAKKLAKFWARKQILLTEIGLDADDAEEVEGALQALIQSGSTDPMTQSLSSMAHLLSSQNLQSTSFSPSATPQLFTGPGHQQPLTISPGFYLDPAYVTEVDSSNYDAHAHSPHAPQKNVNEHYIADHSSETAGYDHLAPSSITAADTAWHGYRSFTSNWIECFSDEGHTYYYNTMSGESSWELPVGCSEIPSGYDHGHSEHGQEQFHHGSAGDERGELSPRGPGLRSPRGSAVGRRGPLPNIPEVNVNCKALGIDRQMVLLSTQDRWQNCLVKCQFFVTEQKALYIKGKEEMYSKVAQRVDSRLATFVDDIKFMQRSLKKELGDLSASERDLRRMFEEDSVDIVHAEKLTFILEAIDKLRENTSTKYEASHKQLAKFVDDWNLIETELLQVGDIFDESTVSNLEQMRMTCEHAAKVFVYDQMKSVNEVRAQELKLMRKKLTEIFAQDTLHTQESRIIARAVQQQQLATRASVRRQLEKEWGQGWDKEIDDELIARNLPYIDDDSQIKAEEEIMLGYLVQEVTMENVLADDYQSVIDATKQASIDLLASIKGFDDEEKKRVVDEGSWFNKQRDAIKRSATECIIWLLNLTICVRYCVPGMLLR